MTTVIICFVIFLVHTVVARILLYKKKLCSKTTFLMLMNGFGCGLLTLFFGFLLSLFLTLGDISKGMTIFYFFAVGAAYCCAVTDNKKAMGSIVGSFILTMGLCTYLIAAFGRY